MLKMRKNHAKLRLPYKNKKSYSDGEKEEIKRKGVKEIKEKRIRIKKIGKILCKEQKKYDNCVKNERKEKICYKNSTIFGHYWSYLHFNLNKRRNNDMNEYDKDDNNMKTSSSNVFDVNYEVNNKRDTSHIKKFENLQRNKKKNSQNEDNMINVKNKESERNNISIGSLVNLTNEKNKSVSKKQNVKVEYNQNKEENSYKAIGYGMNRDEEYYKELKNHVEKGEHIKNKQCVMVRLNNEDISEIKNKREIGTSIKNEDITENSNDWNNEERNKRLICMNKKLGKKMYMCGGLQRKEKIDLENECNDDGCTYTTNENIIYSNLKFGLSSGVEFSPNNALNKINVDNVAVNASFLYNNNNYLKTICNYDVLHCNDYNCFCDDLYHKKALNEKTCNLVKNENINCYSKFEEDKFKLENQITSSYNLSSQISVPLLFYSFFAPFFPSSCLSSVFFFPSPRTSSSAITYYCCFPLSSSSSHSLSSFYLSSYPSLQYSANNGNLSEKEKIFSKEENKFFFANASEGNISHNFILNNDSISTSFASIKSPRSTFVLASYFSSSFTSSFFCTSFTPHFSFFPFNQRSADSSFLLSSTFCNMDFFPSIKIADKCYYSGGITHNGYSDGNLELLGVSEQMQQDETPNKSNTEKTISKSLLFLKKNKAIIYLLSMKNFCICTFHFYPKKKKYKNKEMKMNSFFSLSCDRRKYKYKSFLFSSHFPSSFFLNFFKQKKFTLIITWLRNKIKKQNMKSFRLYFFSFLNFSAFCNNCFGKKSKKNGSKNCLDEKKIINHNYFRNIDLKHFNYYDSLEKNKQKNNVNHNVKITPSNNESNVINRSLSISDIHKSNVKYDNSNYANNNNFKNESGFTFKNNNRMTTNNFCFSKSPITSPKNNVDELYGAIFREEILVVRTTATLLKILVPLSLKFKTTAVENLYAHFIQEEISKHLWWALLLLSFGMTLEYLITIFSTIDFNPHAHLPHLAYTIGTTTIVLGGLLLSFLSRYKRFTPYLELCIALGGSLFASILVFFSDHFRVATFLGYQPDDIWGRKNFSDGPLLLGLNAILWSIAIFLPVRSVCMWPVCVSTVICYQFATYMCGSPDGMRALFMNIILLILLSYLSITGRRLLERQNRLQFLQFSKANCKIYQLQKRISRYKQAPSTTLEMLFSSLRNSAEQVDYVKSCIEDEYPLLSTILEKSYMKIKKSLAQISRIDNIFHVNLNTIFGFSSATPNSENERKINEITKSFIRTNFSRDEKLKDDNNNNACKETNVCSNNFNNNISAINQSNNHISNSNGNKNLVNKKIINFSNDMNTNNKFNSNDNLNIDHKDIDENIFNKNHSEESISMDQNISNKIMSNNAAGLEFSVIRSNRYHDCIPLYKNNNSSTTLSTSSFSNMITMQNKKSLNINNSIHHYSLPCYMLSNIYAYMEGLGVQWNFDVYLLYKRTNHPPLVLIGLYVLECYIDVYLLCQENEILKFLVEVENRYKKNPYHNSFHGGEVCHSMLYLSVCLKIFNRLTIIEQLSLVISSLCHDVAHPARSNAFQIASESEYALTYNDISVLENFHASQTFCILKFFAPHLFGNISKNDFLKFRQLVIELILETDMSKHFESLSKFKVLTQNPEFSMDRSEDRWSVLKICIKASDIGHSAKCWNIHYAWSLKCIQEFFEQGDEELALGLAVSPFCDRTKFYDIPKSQVGFLEYVCFDIFEELANLEKAIYEYEEEKQKQKNSNRSFSSNFLNSDNTNLTSICFSNVSMEEEKEGRSNSAICYSNVNNYNFLNITCGSSVFNSPPSSYLPSKTQGSTAKIKSLLENNQSTKSDFYFNNLRKFNKTKKNSNNSKFLSFITKKGNKRGKAEGRSCRNIFCYNAEDINNTKTKKSVSFAEAKNSKLFKKKLLKKNSKLLDFKESNVSSLIIPQSISSSPFILNFNNTTNKNIKSEHILRGSTITGNIDEENPSEFDICNNYEEFDGVNVVDRISQRNYNFTQDHFIDPDSILQIRKCCVVQLMQNKMTWQNFVDAMEVEKNEILSKENVLNEIKGNNIFSSSSSYFRFPSNSFTN